MNLENNTINNLTFRPITSSDNAAIYSIIRESLELASLNIPGTAYYDEKLSALSDVYGKPDSKYFVLTDSKDTVVGGIGFSPFPFMKETAELQKLYLKEDFHGKGTGYAMIAFIEEEMRKAGFKYSYLETHTNLPAAIHIYEKSGYRLIERPKEVGHSTMNRFFIKEL
jgi:putative acetyltransferase